MVSVQGKTTNSMKSLIPRTSYGRLPQILDVPNLVTIQLDPFRWFQEEGLRLLLEEVSPIKDFTATGLKSALPVMSSGSLLIPSRNAGSATLLSRLPCMLKPGCC